MSSNLWGVQLPMTPISMFRHLLQLQGRESSIPLQAALCQSASAPCHGVNEGSDCVFSVFVPQRVVIVSCCPAIVLQGWPGMYFREPMVGDDRGEAIFWFGVNTVQSNNSQPGMWEATSGGCCYERDRHTRIESNALDYLFR